MYFNYFIESLILPSNLNMHQSFTISLLYYQYKTLNWMRIVSMYVKGLILKHFKDLQWALNLIWIPWGIQIWTLATCALQSSNWLFNFSYSEVNRAIKVIFKYDLSFLENMQDLQKIKSIPYWLRCNNLYNECNDLYPQILK